MLTRTGLVLLLVAASPVRAAEPANLLQEIDTFAHTEQINIDTKQVIDHEVGLGPIRKVRGIWSFKDSERQSGELKRVTWQVVDGFTSREVLEEMEQGLDQETLLYSCEGRRCGDGAQWANRVFGERLLYGRDDLQRYRVYGTTSEQGGYRLILFSSTRTHDRQYLHAELLTIQP